MKKILVTGGAGFIGTNLLKALKELDQDTEIVVLDNYFTGKKENHIEGVQYIEGSIWDIDEIFIDDRFDIVYHFGEYSRIVKSFDDIEYVQKTILTGTPKVLRKCVEWDAKLIYSASSSKFGNNGNDENLSPYSWCKAKIVELIKNYNSWFGLHYEICYFFNVYGFGQIYEGDYATVIGIFEKQFFNKELLTVVKPGTQTRDFTHVEDVVNGIILASETCSNHEWYLRSGVNVSIIDVAEMFTSKWTLIPERRGERFTSEEFYSDTEKLLNWKPKWKLEEWIKKVTKDKFVELE